MVAEPTERAELLAPGREVRVRGRALPIASRTGTSERPIVRLAGVQGRDAAAGLAGEPLEVERAAVGPLGEGEHLIDDLIGLEVSDGAQRVGRVRDVLVLPSVECLDVERPAGGSLLVPLVRDAIRSIDTVGGEIDVNLSFVEAAESSGSDAD